MSSDPLLPPSGEDGLCLIGPCVVRFTRNLPFLPDLTDRSVQLIAKWLQLSLGSDTDADFEAIIVETLMGPLKLLGVDPVEMQEARNFDSYVFAMTPVMLMLAEERTRQGEALESQEEN